MSPMLYTLYMQEISRKKHVVINRVKRVPLVVSLRRFTPFLIFLFIVFLSFVLGIWNIRNFQYGDSKLENVSKEDLDLYLSEFKGKNIFLLRPIEVVDTLYLSNGYIKDVTVKKILPSTLSISIEEFLPFYIGYSSNSCLLFANTGSLIKEICKDCEQECKEEIETTNMVYINSDSVLESNDKLIFFEEIYKVEKLLSEFNYQISNLSIEEGIAIFKDTQGHTFTFDLSNQLDVQLARMYLVGTKINKDMIQYTTLDLRFERPVMNIK